MKHAIGRMSERLALQTSEPAAWTVASLTRVLLVATVTTAANHGYSTGDRVAIAGADQAAYNGTVSITVTGLKTFTYTVAGDPATPATGTITATYVSDAERGRREVWRTFDDTVWAERLPQRTSERLQAQAVIAERFVQYRIYYRTDVVPAQRALLNDTEATLQIVGVTPVGKQWLLLDCTELAA